jgi:phosphate transport system substrate-binding protein
MRPPRRVRPRAAIGVVLLGPMISAAALALAVALSTASPALAAGPYSPADGTGSSYAGLAFQQWVDDGQTEGLPVNYTPTSSPQGLDQYQAGIIPFAGTEAEFSSLLGTPDASIAGGFEYTPDVAGATAVMYNVDDQAGRKVTYLHLAPRTIARIFMGFITNWDDPEITAENLGLALPSHPITIVYRAGQSGTTALFYDFVAHADPSQFDGWATAHHLPTTTRIIQLDNGSNFAPLTEAVSGSDQQAEDVASQPWTISYDEFAYPKTYGAQVAWVENAAGKWTQPYALNITAALATATLNRDLSQDLAGVYASANPLAYPISAYSYIVTKCAANAQFPTCKGTYSDPGLSNSLGTWLSYIACAGQVHMAEIGYAPLPPVLSQDMANSVARITGATATTLNASNCANPRFQGLLGVGSAGPTDPYLGRTTSGGSGPGASSSGGTGSVATTAGSLPTGVAAAGASTPTSTAPAGGAASSTGSSPAAGTASTATTAPAAGSGAVGPAPAAQSAPPAYRQPQPVAYSRPITGGVPVLPLLAFLVLLIIPAVRFGVFRRATVKAKSFLSVHSKASR